jgi:peptidoglycan/LPS O-acetylase OafA/YrhL
MKKTVTQSGSPGRYDNLDGLRAYAAIGIVLMHVLFNGDYGLGGFVFRRLIPSFTDLVFVFMVISGFSLCCGYYEKIVNGKIDLGKFYAKRFFKVWPFFAAMCLVDFLMSPGKETAYEFLADLTLCFGLIPNANIGVIGVGWFLGLVFVFYFLFPFICGLLSNKKSAWLAFAVSLVLSGLCALHFGAERSSFAYSGVFFMAGGMIYLYREPLHRFVSRLGWILMTGLLVAALGGYYFFGSQLHWQLLVSVLMVMLTIGKKNVLLHNPVTKKLSEISMEVYLCHMLVFRVLEKLKVINLFPSKLLSYAVAAVATVVGAVLVSLVAKKILSLLEKLFQKCKFGGTNHVR